MFKASSLGTVLLLVFSVGCTSQTPSPSPHSPQSGGAVRPDVWKTVKLDGFSVDLPTELNRVDVHCREGGCYRFEGAEMVFKIDLSVDAGTPTFEKSFPSYSESFCEINGKKAWTWTVEHETGAYKFESGVKFNVLGRARGFDAGMYLFSKTAEARNIAKRIFGSVHFESGVKIY